MRLLEKLTPKRILIVWGILAALGYIIATRTPLPYADLLGIFIPNVAALFLVSALATSGWYSLRNCGIPPFSPAEYSYILYLCPLALILGVTFFIALIKTKSKRNLLWILTLTWTLLELFASLEQLFTYFCFPLEIIR